LVSVDLSGSGDRGGNYSGYNPKISQRKKTGGKERRGPGSEEEGGINKLQVKNQNKNVLKPCKEKSQRVPYP